MAQIRLNLPSKKDVIIQKAKNNWRNPLAISVLSNLILGLIILVLVVKG